MCDVPGERTPLHFRIGDLGICCPLSGFENAHQDMFRFSARRHNLSLDLLSCLLLQCTRSFKHDFLITCVWRWVFWFCLMPLSCDLLSLFCLDFFLSWFLGFKRKSKPDHCMLCTCYVFDGCVYSSLCLCLLLLCACLCICVFYGHRCTYGDGGQSQVSLLWYFLPFQIAFLVGLEIDHIS